METVLVISDSHNNRDLLQTVLEQEETPDHIIHLGDNYNDLDPFSDHTGAVRIHKVPGIYHPGYLDGSIPARLEIRIRNWNFTLVHDIRDYLKQPSVTDIICYGHSHLWEITVRNNLILMNPGHLKALTDKGREPSYAVLNIADDTVGIQIRNLDKNILHEVKVSKQDLEG